MTSSYEHHEHGKGDGFAFVMTRKCQLAKRERERNRLAARKPRKLRTAKLSEVPDNIPLPVAAAALAAAAVDPIDAIFERARAQVLAMGLGRERPMRIDED